MSTATKQRTFDQEATMSATALVEANGEQRADNPLAILELAVRQGTNAAELRELMELQRDWAKDRAAEAFSTALTQFQRKCRFVTKTRTAKIESRNGPGYKYNYAGFDDVMEQAGPVLDECELAVSFSTEAIEKGIRCTCRIRKGIHFEDHTIDVPIPQMSVNDTQRYGAALSYAKRYALCAALNIVVTDDVDDDGASCLDVISEEQEATLRDWIENKGVNLERFLEWAGVKQLADMPVDKFQPAIDYLKRK